MYKMIVQIFVFWLFFMLNRSDCSVFKYETRYFKQKVDHFTYYHDEYFDQRYLLADQYWNVQRGPIFFYTGNEGDISMFANNTGYMWELAAEFKALVVFAEHRYYGVSIPKGNNSKNNEYLTTEQALADYATLLSHLKEMNHTMNRRKVIAFGGSYGGMLSAWIRMKYPHIVDGAISSSAPILWFPNLTRCDKFAEIVTKVFHQAGSECSASIKRSWKTIRDFGKTEFGAQLLSKTFNLCTNITSLNVQKLISWLEETWEYLAMTNYPYPTDFLVPLPANPILVACKYLRNASEPDEDLLLNIMKAASVYQNYTGTVKCFNISSSSAKALGVDTWNFQTCTEMVMPICQNGITDMFEPSPWDFEAFSEECLQDYNVKPDPNIAIIMYGGKNINASSNIIFSNGKLDPWSGGGVLKSLSDTLIAYVMDGAAHHLDLRSPNPADPESVVKVRALERKWISKWLQI